MIGNVVATKKARLWAPWRKVMGNLIPALIALPFAAYGLGLMWSQATIGGKGLLFFAMSPLVLWLATNWFGLFQNRFLRVELQKDLKRSSHKEADDRVFVGVATPKYTSLLDPHEDIGFLLFLADRIEFFGDSLNLSINRRDISAIQYRPNIHSMIGLGRWISVDGRMSDHRIRLQIEPREKVTLLGNFLYSRELRKKLDRWLKS